MSEKKLVDIEGLTRYHENLNSILSDKAEKDHTHEDYAKLSDVESMIAESITIALNTEV